MDVKMNIENSFIHTGIRHRVVEDGKCIILDQFDYAAVIKPLADTYFEKLNDAQPLNEELNACFLTLLGAMAWLVQTRLDIVIYVSSSQRIAKKPTVMDLKRINCLCRYVKSHQHGLEYRLY